MIVVVHEQCRRTVRRGDDAAAHEAIARYRKIRNGDWATETLRRPGDQLRAVADLYRIGWVFRTSTSFPLINQRSLCPMRVDALDGGLFRCE